MADETKPTTGFPDVAKNNAEVAAKLAAQDVMAQSTAADPNGDSGDALDALAAQVKPKEEVAAPVAETVTPEQKAKVEADKAAADKAAAENAEHAKRAEDIFKDSPSLAPNASPKSSEAFSAVKIKAAQEIAARDADLEKIRKENAELQERVKSAVPPETLKELNEHREWRAKLDVDADPKFRDFDKAVAQTHDFIYAQLKKNPAVSDEVIEQIKKLGGPDKVDFTKVWELAKDPALQRLVESKVADIEMVKFNKQQAIDAAKANVQQYMTQRQEQFAKSVTGHRDSTRQEYGKLSGALDWMKPQTPKADADATEKARVEAHNKFVTDTQGQIEAALNDDSPQMRAIMLTGMAQLFNLQKIHEGAVTENAALKKVNEELEAKLAKFKNVSVNRLREGGAAPGAQAKIEKKSGDDFRSASQALDDVAKQVMEEHQRVANTGR